MKIKLTFTDEHIALIKAMNFGNLDVREIMNSYNFVDRNMYVLEPTERDEDMVKSYTPAEIMAGLEYRKLVCNNYRIGELLDKNHVALDGLFGFDTFNLWGGTFLWEQMAYILGYQDAIVPSTKEDPSGPKFYETVYTGLDENGKRIISLEEHEGLEKMDVIEHLKDLDSFMVTNLTYIMDILLQFCTEGIQKGVTYWAYDYQRIWHKEE